MAYAYFRPSKWNKNGTFLFNDFWSAEQQNWLEFWNISLDIVHLIKTVKFSTRLAKMEALHSLIEIKNEGPDRVW